MPHRRQQSPQNAQIVPLSMGISRINCNLVLAPRLADLQSQVKPPTIGANSMYQGVNQMRIALLIASVFCATAAAEDLTCLKPQPGEPAASTLFYASLQKQAYAALDRRQGNYESLKTEEQIKAYQQQLREVFIEQLGGFPERTPLNA